MQHLSIVVVVGFVLKACLAYGTKGAGQQPQSLMVQRMTSGGGYNSGGRRAPVESTSNQMDWLPKVMMMLRNADNAAAGGFQPIKSSGNTNRAPTNNAMSYASGANIGGNMFGGFERMATTKGGSSSTGASRPSSGERSNFGRSSGRNYGGGGSGGDAMNNFARHNPSSATSGNYGGGGGGNSMNSVSFDDSTFADYGNNAKASGAAASASGKGGSGKPTATYGHGDMNGYGGGGGGGNKDSQRGRQVVQAAVKTKHSFEERPVPIDYEELEPQVIEVEGGGAPLEIHFKSSSSRIKVHHSHESAEPAAVEMTQSDEEPHRMIHTVNKPIISEIRENIIPYRKVIQMINPVEESIHTIVAKGEAAAARGKANKGGAYDDQQQQQQHLQQQQMFDEPDSQSGYGARMFTSGAATGAGGGGGGARHHGMMAEAIIVGGGGGGDGYKTNAMNINGFALGMMTPAAAATAPKGLNQQQPRRLTKGGY